MCITYGGDEYGNGQSSKPYCPWQESGGYPQRGNQWSGKTTNKTEKKQPIFYKSIGETIRFYAAYGRKECGKYSTKWCRKHCYLKTQPFKEKDIKKIKKIKLENYTIETVEDLVKCIKNEKYVTFFSSGCIENIGENSIYSCDGKGVILYIYYLCKQISTKAKDIKIRFFIRNPDILKKTKMYVDKIYEKNPNSIFILSIDKDNSNKYLDNSLKNPLIDGIAIIDHIDNYEIIRYLKSQKIHKFIYCRDCNNTMLCFNQKEKFVLIQDYKKAK